MAAFAASGGQPAACAREVGERCEVVLTLLPSTGALDEVISGLGGLFAIRSGTPVVAECSTLPIAAKLAASERLAAARRDDA